LISPAKRFLIVDNDPVNNLICKMVLKQSLGEVEVKDFIYPELALEYIEAEYEANQSEDKTTLFLDINMPTLTGWEFLVEFNTFNNLIKNQFDIYMLSSSVDPDDIQRAKSNPLVIDIIEKPLKKLFLVKLFG
jgi:CheY-like chemotaxis protein